MTLTFWLPHYSYLLSRIPKSVSTLPEPSRITLRSRPPVPLRSWSISNGYQIPRNCPFHSPRTSKPPPVAFPRGRRNLTNPSLRRACSRGKHLSAPLVYTAVFHSVSLAEVPQPKGVRRFFQRGRPIHAVPPVNPFGPLESSSGKDLITNKVGSR